MSCRLKCFMSCNGVSDSGNAGRIDAWASSYIMDDDEMDEMEAQTKDIGQMIGIKAIAAAPRSLA